MERWRDIAFALSLLAGGFISGCDLGWNFLTEGGGGNGGGDAIAQTSCQNSRVVVGQFPAIGSLFTSGSFTADYSSPNLNGSISSDSATALGLRISRHRLWLNDLAIEVSFFPLEHDPTQDPRNGCLGRAILEINIPFEDLSFDRTIEIGTTRLSQTEPSAFYTEGGDPGFTASAVNGTINLQSVGGNRVAVTFDFTFNPGTNQRRLTNGEIEDEIDLNPVVEGLQPG